MNKRPAWCIADVDAVLLSVPLPDRAVVRWCGGVMRTAQVSLVRVRSEDGDYGLGEVYAGLWAPEVVAAIVDVFRPRLLGLDARKISAVWREMHSSSLYWAASGIGLATVGAIEMALYDLVGKVREVPVYDLLGGATREELRLYASGGLTGSPTELAEEVLGYVAAGYELIKIRAGNALQTDVQRVKAAYDAAGDRAKLAVDAVQGHHPSPWHASTALTFAEQIEPLGLAWLEEPCGNSDWEGYATVRRHTRVPIAGGESTNGLLQFRRICELGAVDILQPDASHVGGLREMQRVANLAHSFGVRTVPHVWGAGVGIMANYHVCFATDECTLAEYPTWESPLRGELLSSSVQLANGVVRRPEVPGLGVELREETILKYPFIPGAGVEMVKADI